MIYVIDADVERVTSEALRKAQEDFDLIASFAQDMRLHYETIILLEDDDTPTLASMKDTRPLPRSYSTDAAPVTRTSPIHQGCDADHIGVMDND